MENNFMVKITKAEDVMNLIGNLRKGDVEELEALGNYLKTLDNVEKLEVLPYHSMGQSKYESMGMEYPLKGTPQLTKDQAKAAESIIRRAWGREL